MRPARLKTHQYYEFIDGMRALAIGLVLIFHFELFHFPGGFLGVDVFFVISGFLVSGIIIRDLDKGQFSLGTFYRRRVIRILPALYASLFIVLMFAYFFLLPDDAIQTARSAKASALFVANHHFYNNVNYFNNSETGWFLLHHWSLSVEEQFYLIFPVAALVLFKSKVNRSTTLIVVTVIAFVGSLYFVQRNSSGAFYFAITRFWEFLAGVQIALMSRHVSLRKWQAETLSILALALILIPAIIISSSNEFFGIPATFPIFGAALMIWVNLSSTGTLANVALTFPAVKFLGKISYSVYLVHWPVLIFGRYISVMELTVETRLALLLISILFGWLSWRFIETPLRKSAALLRISGVRFVLGTIFTTCLVVLLANLVITQKSAPDAMSVETRHALSGKNDFSPQRGKCHSEESAKAIAPENACQLGASKEPTIAVWSDSHGVELVKALATKLEPENIALSQLTSSSCPPLIAWDSALQPRCRTKNDEILAYLRSSKTITTAVLTMRFDGYPETGITETLDALERSVSMLVRAEKTIILVAPFPKPDFDVPNGTARMLNLPLRHLPPGISRTTHDGKTRVIRERLREISARHGATLIDPADSLCSDISCPYNRDGRMLYFDDNHPSMEGVRGVADSIARVIITARDDPPFAPKP